jgi:hypothetical protein
MALVAALGTFLLYIVKRKLSQEKVSG